MNLLPFPQTIYNFPTDAHFNILFPQTIYIFPVLCIDTHIGHIYVHIRSCCSGHYGLFVENGDYGMSQYGHKYGQYWCRCKEQEKFGSPVKAELKIMHRLKSYGQNKIFRQKVAKNG